MSTAADVRRSSRRIGLYTAALVAGAMLVVGTFVFTGFQRSIHALGVEQMRATVANIDDPEEAPAGVLLVVVKEKSGKRKESPGIPAGLPHEADLRATAEDRRTRDREVVLASGDTWVIRTQAHKHRLGQAMVSLSARHDDIRTLLRVLVVGSALGVVVAALIGIALARRTLAPMAEVVDLQRRFIADASHELRTPLTLLSTRVQMLSRRLRSTGSADVATEVDGVGADASRLADILDDLLLAADPRESATIDLIDLRQAVDSVVESAAAVADERGIVVNVSGDGAEVRAAATSVRRAILALVDNALDHAVSRVDIRVTGGRQCRIDVGDDGPGFGEQQLTQVFDRFTSARPPGEARRHYGIGLALVADVAHAHGGRVEAGRSDLGGALVTLTLPAARR